MSSPTKRIDVEKDNTMFGQLSNVEVHRSHISETHNNIKQELSRIIIDNKPFKKLAIFNPKIRKTILKLIKNKAKRINKEIRIKDVHLYTKSSKNFLITQKAEYMRLSNQINTMIQNSKEINSQLTLLASKFD